jgi:hypothetical protein
MRCSFCQDDDELKQFPIIVRDSCVKITIAAMIATVLFCYVFSFIRKPVHPEEPELNCIVVQVNGKSSSVP